VVDTALLVRGEVDVVHDRSHPPARSVALIKGVFEMADLVARGAFTTPIRAISFLGAS
jgi:hypothetical protein